MRIFLTPLESAILRHRLGVPEAIAEAIDKPVATARHCAELLLEGLYPKHLETCYVETTYPKTHKEILADAVEGSTFYASADVSEQRRAAIVRAGESLAEKIGAYVGRNLIFPTW